MASRLAVIALVVAVAGLLIFVGILPSFSGPQTTKLTGTKSITVSDTQSATQPESSSRSHIVPPSEIVSGGPPPDGIPSIDNPKFILAREVNQFIPAGQINQFLPVSQTNPISDSSTVIGIYYNGEAKVYPLYILVWHEIVNDVVGGKPVAITYCPLCYSSAAFVREHNGTTVTFGTSGKLYNNNLVMYDRLTSSLWSEIWGEAISGKLTGSVLQRVPIDVTTWGEWKALYPNTPSIDHRNRVQQTLRLRSLRRLLHNPRHRLPVEPPRRETSGQADRPRRLDQRQGQSISTQLPEWRDHQRLCRDPRDCVVRDG